ncbi:MATE family efflux transporter [Mesomycoplasma hyopneumoniae]|uniref:MATE family efflux transporter n=1 Tax=Mesomycoplasma hyopneumoniae TaxID=2099 RepID=UPI0038579741
MRLSVRQFFPDSAEKWKKFAKIVIPVIFATLFISINNFIDNFMVSQISGGITAVGIANVWTAIIFSFIVSINSIGSIIFSQYWGKKQRKLAKQVNNIRYILAVTTVLIFAIFAWIIPDQMLSAVQRNKNLTNLDKNIFEEAKSYLFIIAFSWILFAYIVTSSAILREIGIMKIALFFTLLTLISNVSLNLVLIPKMGVAGSALATVISRCISAILMTFYIFFYKKEIRISILKLFKIEKKIWKQYFRRFFGMNLVIITSLIISIRSILWAQSLPPGSIGSDDGTGFYKYWGIGFLTISGIVMTIVNILLATFTSIQTSVSIVVSRNLGQDKIEKARKNAAMLKGFLFIVSLAMSILALIVVIIITKTNLITKGLEIQVQKGMENYFTEHNLAINLEIIQKQQGLATNFYLSQIFWICLLIVFLNPIWVQINSSLNIIQAGGRANFSSLCDFFIGISQFLWQLLVIFVFLPLLKDVKTKLFFSMLIFYFSDIIKWIIYEILYLKTNWAINLTLEKTAKKIL